MVFQQSAWGGGLLDKSGTVACVVSLQTTCESFGLRFMWQNARKKKKSSVCEK